MSPYTPSKQVNGHSGFDYVVRSALAGGFAGGVAKTAIAPLDRVKILFQTHNGDFKRFSGSWKGIPQALQHIVQTQGFKGLYQGHTLTLARSVPNAAIVYTVYDKVKKIIMPTPESQTPFRRLLSGAATGLTAMPITFPFELIRVRMATDTTPSRRPTPFTAMRSIWTEAGSKIPLLHFYRGFPLTAAATIPYRGSIFLIWETLNAHARERLRPDTLNAYQTQIHLLIGAIAGSVAEVVTFPLGVVRHTQQASGAAYPERVVRVGEVVRGVWKQAGWRGFYAGLGIGMVKQVPMHAVSLAAWQIAKGVLDIHEQ